MKALEVWRIIEAQDISPQSPTVRYKYWEKDTNNEKQQWN